MERFFLDGFAIIPECLDCVAVEALKHELQRVLDFASRLAPAELTADFVLERDLPDSGRSGVPREEVGEAIFVAGNLGKYSRLFCDLFTHPRIHATAATVLESEDLDAHFINATIKHPRFGRKINWHRDYPNRYISAVTSDFVRIMLCLDGMTENGGATRFIPGSHIVPDVVARQPKQKLALSDCSGVAAVCDPGDLVIIHPKVIHGSPQNFGLAPRRNIVLQIGRKGIALTGSKEFVTGMPLRTRHSL